MQRTTQAPLSLQMAKRCGAKTRNRKPCQSPVVKGRRAAAEWTAEHTGQGLQAVSVTAIIGTGSIRRT